MIPVPPIGSSIGEDGIDVTTDATQLPATALADGYNIDLSRGVVARRLGARKLGALSGSSGSKTFGADTKYATLATATQLLIPQGGFLARVSFVASRPAAGRTAYVVSSRPAAVAWHVFSITLSDAGVVVVTWRDSGGNTRTVTCAALTDAAIANLLAIYDAPAGTFTVYINGAASGTPLTGLASTLKPDQTATDWVFGVEKQTGAAVTANSFLPGAIDGFMLQSLVGIRPSEGSPSFTDVRRKHSLRQWPAPDEAGVLAFCDFDNSSLTVLYDASDWKTNGTMTGTPSNTGAVPYASVPGNAALTVQNPSGRVTNLVAAGGAMSYETIRGV